jgi:hypothetical protein
VHDIALADQVFLALEAQLAGFLGAVLAVVLDKVVVADDLGADEAALKVGVITPAACGAVAPRFTVQARTSFGPAVK